MAWWMDASPFQHANPPPHAVKVVKVKKSLAIQNSRSSDKLMPPPIESSDKRSRKDRKEAKAKKTPQPKLSCPARTQWATTSIRDERRRREAGEKAEESQQGQEGQEAPGQEAGPSAGRQPFSGNRSSPPSWNHNLVLDVLASVGSTRALALCQGTVQI